MVEQIDGEFNVYMIGARLVLYRQQLKAARILMLAKCESSYSLTYKLHSFDSDIGKRFNS